MVVCSSGGAAVYLYTGKVAHPLAAPHLVLTGSRSKSGSGRTHGAFVEQPPRSRPIQRGSSRNLTTVAQKPSLVVEVVTTFSSFQVP